MGNYFQYVSNKLLLFVSINLPLCFFLYFFLLCPMPWVAHDEIHLQHSLLYQVSESNTEMFQLSLTLSSDLNDAILMTLGNQSL